MYHGDIHARRAEDEEGGPALQTTCQSAEGPAGAPRPRPTCRGSGVLPRAQEVCWVGTPFSTAGRRPQLGSTVCRMRAPSRSCSLTGRQCAPRKTSTVINRHQVCVTIGGEHVADGRHPKCLTDVNDIIIAAVTIVSNGAIVVLKYVTTPPSQALPSPGPLAFSHQSSKVVPSSAKRREEVPPPPFRYKKADP